MDQVEGDGTNTNRLAWKCLCSVLLAFEMAVYFVWVKTSVVLCVIGGVFLIKALIEIWGQETATWVCPATVFMLVVVYGPVWPSIFCMFGYCTQSSDIQFLGRDELGLALYLGGSFYSLAYEVGRFRWKARPENKGKLHTVGLASWCIHPNYFGDLFTYTGWGLAAGTTCAVSVPVLMFFTFVLVVVPNSDNYLSQRYPKEFPAYAAHTATLIPGLHSKVLSQVLAWLCLLLCIYSWCFRCPGPCGY
ncbi:unnamed protein product [Durusdinium trenchii]|uniref:Steroid 5-alpha reductase C-terminal domain-containing protein n=1 Tax=Durusdinium trenchii TaxID=1381693 RepID=A0ABP0IH03_9DINO